MVQMTVHTQHQVVLQSCKTASILVYLGGNDCLTVCLADTEVNKLYERPVAATRGGGAPNCLGVSAQHLLFSWTISWLVDLEPAVFYCCCGSVTQAGMNFKINKANTVRLKESPWWASSPQPLKLPWLW